jgi:hypothetical protein
MSNPTSSTRSCAAPSSREVDGDAGMRNQFSFEVAPAANKPR